MRRLTVLLAFSVLAGACAGPSTLAPGHSAPVPPGETVTPEGSAGSPAATETRNPASSPAPERTHAPRPLPPCEIADAKAHHRKLRDWQRTLVDWQYSVGSAYAPADLVAVREAGLAGKGSVRSLVIDDLAAMARAAADAGAPLYVQSAYRSYRTQADTFDYWTSVGGYDQAILTSARPGHSEHQLGTALDFTSLGGKAPWEYDDWAETRAGAWMREHAWEYGFVLSYPDDRESVCYSYEPWHFRYFGRDTAAAIVTSGLTPREWLWERHLADR